jgi:hypothetical protein
MAQTTVQGTPGILSTETKSREPVRLALRKLWSDHVFWTREYIIAATKGPHGLTDVAEELPVGSAGAPVANAAQAALGAAPMSDADAAAARLLKNQDDIGKAIVPYYGEGAGNKLTDLLKQHIMIAVELVADAKSGNQDKFAKDDAAWTDNAAQIAKFLAGANPAWPEKDVMDLLALHLKLTKDEVVARLSQDWNAAIKAFDDIFTEILVLADTLYDGLVAQFPDKFGKTGASA